MDLEQLTSATLLKLEEIKEKTATGKPLLLTTLLVLYYKLIRVKGMVSLSSTKTPKSTDDTEEGKQKKL